MHERHVLMNKSVTEPVVRRKELLVQETRGLVYKSFVCAQGVADLC